MQQARSFLKECKNSFYHKNGIGHLLRCKFFTRLAIVTPDRRIGSSFSCFILPALEIWPTSFKLLMKEVTLLRYQKRNFCQYRTFIGGKKARAPTDTTKKTFLIFLPAACESLVNLP
jgi:hypothetical protein